VLSHRKDAPAAGLVALAEGWPAVIGLATQVACHLAQREQWDEAFLLVDRFFSERVFVELLEGALQDLLREARFPTLTLWLKLARAQRADAAIVDFAEAEVAFRQAMWTRAEHFAARAARRLPQSHRLISHAFYTAGSSAHMDYRNQDGLIHFGNAREAAFDQASLRDAIWGQIMCSVDLEA